MEGYNGLAEAPQGGAFKDVAIVFSFGVNFRLLVLLVAVSVPAARAPRALETGAVEPLLNRLDSAFVGLGEAKSDAEVDIIHPILARFVLKMDQRLPVRSHLWIEQDTDVRPADAVPPNVPARCTLLGGGDVINGRVSLSLPVGQRLPTQLSVVVPVSTAMPVRMHVPSDQIIPITMAVPVHIELGEAGFVPAGEDLRGVFHLLREQIENLSDGLEFL